MPNGISDLPPASQANLTDLLAADQINPLAKNASGITTRGLSIQQLATVVSPPISVGFGLLNTAGVISLDQGAAPTWTALHTFSAGLTVPTEPPGDNSINAASTAFVQAAIVAGAVGVVSSISALAALAIPSGNQAIIVSDAVQGGTFVWSAANLSMSVSNNPGRGTYVPPSSDTTGASGAWIRQYVTVPGQSNINASGAINVNTLASTPFVTDGTTSNINTFHSLLPVLQGVGREMPVPVNITVGTPTVLSINPTTPSGGTSANPAVHGLKPNQAFYFTLSAGGSLPSGISLNTLYYIRSGTQGTTDALTGTQFTFSTTNNYGLLPSLGSFTNEGAAVNTTGSLTGTLSIVLTGRGVSLFFPPGPYFNGNFGDAVPACNVTPNGMSRIKYYAYDAQFDSKVQFGTAQSWFIANPKTWAPQIFDLVNTTPNDNGVPLLDGVITFRTPADAGVYYVGQMICIFGLDIQNSFGVYQSSPPNNHYFEFKRIKALTVVAGAITTLTVDGPFKWCYLSTFPNMFNATGRIGGGTALIGPMHPNWDMEVEVHGARWVSQPGESQARYMLFNDCTFSGYGFAPGGISPSDCQTIIYRNCVMTNFDAGSFAQIDKMIEYLEFDTCRFPDHYVMQFPSTSVHQCVVKNHKGSSFDGTPRQINIRDSEFPELLVGPDADGVTDSCVVENSRIVWFNLNQRNDENLAIQPANDMQLIPNWTFSNGTFTRDLSLAGNQSMLWQIPGAKIYMTDASNQFKYFQNMGGVFTILNTYLSGSNFSFDTTLGAIPTRQSTVALTSISNASPAVFTSTAPHGFTAGVTPIVLTTTGTLPTGLSRSTIYWVTNDGTFDATHFHVSTTLAGAAAGTGQVNTSSAGSGTHTAYGNPLCFRPHPCTRFTGIGNSGCSALIDQNGLVDEPLFSHIRRGFGGKQNATNPSGFQQPLPNIWGFLKSMTVNVRKAGTASGTLTLGSPGFPQPNLATLSTFSQVIDTTVAGVRSWVGGGTPTFTLPNGTSAAIPGGDTISAYADWIAGPMVFTPSVGVSLVNSPVVEVEIFTDQGITKFGAMIGAPGTPASGFTWQYIDSGINQQFGSTP